MSQNDFTAEERAIVAVAGGVGTVCGILLGVGMAMLADATDFSLAAMVSGAIAWTVVSRAIRVWRYVHSALDEA